MAKKSIPTYEESIASFQRLHEAYEAKEKLMNGSRNFEEYKANEAEGERMIAEAYHGLIPRVGLKVSIVYYSDYRAATVTEVVSPTKVIVTHNKVKCLDWYAGDYETYDELQEGRCDVFTKRRNGLWVMEGQESRDGVVLALNFQRHFIDPCY